MLQAGRKFKPLVPVAKEAVMPPVRPVAPILRRARLTPEAIADPKEQLSVRSQIAVLDESAIALRDDCLGFTLAAISMTP
jgi:hypothetical protein